jgi:uroporphyrinogen decarboxylase
MNGYQRIQAALKGEWPDRVPVMLHNFMMAARECRVTQTQFRNDPKVMADCFIASVEKYGYDGIYVDMDTVTLAGALGVPVDFPEDEPARSHEAFLGSLEDINDLKKVDISSYKYVRIWLEAVRILKEHFKDEVFIRGNCDQAPFSLASMLRTPTEWMMDLCYPDRREMVFRLLDYCCDATCQFVSLMAETGCHMVSNGDSPAGPEMISPDMYEEFAFPYEQKVVGKAHEKGLTYTLHICGNTTSILEKMPETGADAVELDYKTDIHIAHDLFKDRITFIGNIDPSGIIAMGTPQLVREKTRELLKVYCDTPRFILNAGCAIPPDAPPDNLKILIEAAGEFERVAMPI